MGFHPMVTAWRESHGERDDKPNDVINQRTQYHP